METAELRALQQPLKDRYRSEPGTALTPVAATGRFVGHGVAVEVDQAAGPARAGLHRATGGDGSEACSADMLLEALLACAGVTFRSVATAMGLPVRVGEVRAQGAFDARGTLGVDRTVPVGLQDVVVRFEVQTDADDAALARLASATERYCVVGRSLATPPRFEVRRMLA
ncbi:MAG TPA: OsmC family protein [Marmoricola sp.]|nr:OsmC family protein [Marmoricola sp.]